MKRLLAAGIAAGALALVLSGCTSSLANGNAASTSLTNTPAGANLAATNTSTPAETPGASSSVVNAETSATRGVNAAETGSASAASDPAAKDPSVPASGAAASGAAKPKPGDEVAVLETAQGRIVFEFLTNKAPRMSANFKKLAKAKYYDGTAFHRVIPGFMIQGGDPNSKSGASGQPGTGGPGYGLKDEFNDTKHVAGIVSMASSGPDTAGSQFFICVGDATFLDGKYSAFGRVVSGQNVADRIVALSRDSNDMPTAIDQARVKSVRIARWPVK